MKKLLLLMTALLMGISGAWAESKISKAVAGTYLFDSSNPALTVNKGGATITSSDGAIVIHHDDLSIVTNSRTYAAVVMKVDMPTTALSSFSQFINLKTSSNTTASIGLGVTTEGKLKGTWQAGEYGPETSSAVTGEHTIVMLCNDSGTTIYVDDASTSVNNSNLKCATKWTDLRIESAYVSCVKSVYVFSGDQASNIAAFFSELSNVVTVANGETKKVSDNSTATRFFVASGGALTADAAYDLDNDATYDLDKIEGAGDVTLDVDATISGNISTVATGKLIINEGKTLTLGTGEAETNSIESFSSIELSGTIKHNNSKATFNGVTVPANHTGNIFAYDMLDETDGFELAGTTTVNGNLNVGNLFNFQMKVDELSGSGTLLICGMNQYTFDPTKTESNEAATINITSASSYTGSMTVNNSIATVNLSDNLNVSALSGSGTLNVASGASITTPSVPSTMTLTGAGDVVLTSFPTATAPTLTDWTGAIEFPENSSATNITDIFNAWGNENSTIKINNTSGYFSKTNDPVNPTLNILSGKTLTINNGYSDYPPVLRKLTGEGNINLSWTGWSKSFNLTIQNLTDFGGTLTTATAPVVVKKLVLEETPDADALLIKTSGTVTLNTEDPDGLYVGLQRTSAYTWETKIVNEVEGIYVSAFDQVQQYREMATAVVTPYFGYIGTGVGKYTISLGVNGYTTIGAFTGAINAWTETSDYVVPTVTINQPTSAFYRIKSGSKYLKDVRKSDDATQRLLTDAEGSNASAETIFYLNSNTLVGYKTGYGFGFSVCQTQDTEHLNTQLFTESSETGTGKYTIQSQQGTYGSASYNEGFWGVDGSELSRVNDAASGACWTIEEVTSLPVTIGVYNMKTFNAPVAVTIPYDVEAYYATLDENNVILTQIEGTIPKNTPVILYRTDNETVGSGEARTFDFAIADDVDAITGNALTGTIAAKAIETGDHTLQYNKSTNQFGFYLPLESETCIKGFSAYISVSEESRGFQLIMPSTGVETISFNSHQKNIYDLQGRRIEKAGKGLYIVNGKKVIF